MFLVTKSLHANTQVGMWRTSPASVPRVEKCSQLGKKGCALLALFEKGPVQPLETWGRPNVSMFFLAKASQ